MPGILEDRQRFRRAANLPRNRIRDAVFVAACQLFSLHAATSGTGGVFRLPRAGNAPSRSLRLPDAGFIPPHAPLG
ncbi:MAG: hypothetical protein II595_04300, partial [Desulfovibrio sp.]|nr:hypothetical protein [Desulfovibrio sp.]